MYSLNDEVRSLAQKVIDANEEFAHLAYCRIAYMYSDKKKTHNGRTVFADTTKLSEMMKDLTGYDFVITFYGPSVDDLPELPLNILMYHELLHVGYDPSTHQCWLVPHDVEDFACIIAQYGIDWAKPLDAPKQDKD